MEAVEKRRCGKSENEVERNTTESSRRSRETHGIGDGMEGEGSDKVRDREERLTESITEMGRETMERRTKMEMSNMGRWKEMTVGITGRDREMEERDLETHSSICAMRLLHAALGQKSDV